MVSTRALNEKEKGVLTSALYKCILRENRLIIYVMAIVFALLLLSSIQSTPIDSLSDGIDMILLVGLVTIIYSLFIWLFIKGCFYFKKRAIKKDLKSNLCSIAIMRIDAEWDNDYFTAYYPDKKNLQLSKQFKFTQHTLFYSKEANLFHFNKLTREILFHYLSTCKNYELEFGASSLIIFSIKKINQ